MRTYIDLKNIVISACLLTLTGFMNAQTIVSGTVVDIDNQPIEFANVVLLNKEKNEIILGTITDEKGNFTIATDKKGEFNLQISFVGFKDYLKSINSTIDFENIVLTSNNELTEVVINARKNIIERKEDKIILNIKNGNLSKGYTGVEVLKYAPNIWIDNSDNILIHNKPAIIFVNGRKINLLVGELSNYIKSMDSDDIEKIEIQTNARANIDAENNGGVINIVTKKKPKGFKARLKSYYSQKESGYYTINPSLNFSYGTEKWNIYGNYGYKKNTDSPAFNSENLEKINSILYRSSGSLIEKNNKNNYQLGFVYDITKNQTIGIESYGSTSKNTSVSNSSINITQEKTVLDTGNIKLDENNNKETFNGLLNYSIKFDSIKSKINFFVDYTKQDISNNNNNSSIYDNGFFNNTNEQNSSNILSEIISPQIVFHKQARFLNFEIGSKYTTTNRSDDIISQTLENNIFIDNDRTTSYDYNENIIAGYFSALREFNKYFVKVGIRYENTTFKGVNQLDNNDIVNQNYDNLFPSIYLKRNLTNGKSISLSYSKSTTRPSFSYLNNSIRKIDDFTYSIGNPDLRPEYTNKYNASLNLKNQTFNLYYSITTDKINTRWFVVNNTNLHQSQNIGTSKEVGLNYSLNTKIKKWWYLSSQVITLFREFETGNYTSSKPSFMFSNSNIFKINNNTSIDLSIQYISPFIDGYFTNAENFEANFIFKKTFLKDKLYLRFYIDDIFNTTRNKNNSSFDDLNTNFYQKRKTRNFTLWLSYNFSTKHKINNKINETKNDAKNRL